MNDIVEIQHCPNQHMRVYHVREQLTEKQIEISGSADAGAVTEELARIRGIACVTVERYQVSITKGKAFDWAEVEPAVLEFLRLFNNGEGPDV